MKSHKRHVLMTGGGTLGPVTPLLAIAREWERRDPDVKISWIGTPRWTGTDDYRGSGL